MLYYTIVERCYLVIMVKLGNAFASDAFNENSSSSFGFWCKN